MVETEDIVVCIEAKLREDGMGTCSCQSPERECSPAVLARRRYWETARQDFGLTERTVGEPCPISLGYQAVRNAAAARALAGGRRAVFALFYDERNPYFRATGDWPGWPDLLAASLARSERVRFRAVSWQELVPLLPLDDAARAWAVEKHGLGV